MKFKLLIIALGCIFLVQPTFSQSLGDITKLIGLVSGGGGIDESTLVKMNKIKEIVENTVCLKKEMDFNMSFYLSSNSCMFNIRKEVVLANYTCTISAVSSSLTIIAKTISSIATGKTTDSEAANKKLDRIIAAAEKSVQEMNELNKSMNSDMMAALLKTNGIIGTSTGRSSVVSKNMKSIF